jgi:hypothetical protein
MQSIRLGGQASLKSQHKSLRDFLSLHAPSSLSVALAISHAVLPKQAQLDRLQKGFVLPVEGLPQTIHVDNAKEFRGHALERGCRGRRIHQGSLPGYKQSSHNFVPAVFVEQREAVHIAKLFRDVLSYPRIEIVLFIVGCLVVRFDGVRVAQMDRKPHSALRWNEYRIVGM